jgi:protein involved in polysaccharide export with SLBB domain
MRVADLIRVGGGLKPSADIQAVRPDLVKYEWTAATGSDPGTGQSPSKLSGQQEEIAHSGSALSGDVEVERGLWPNGDVLTIRELPGWNDLGASIALKGESPASRAVRDSSRGAAQFRFWSGPAVSNARCLSFWGCSAEGAGARPGSRRPERNYPACEKRAEDELQLHAGRGCQAERNRQKRLALQQWQETLDQLSADPPLGRVTIRISSHIDRWKNTPADIEVRAGDVLIVPKRPSYVMVTGQVFNPTAVSYRPGKSANWYLSQSGGPTPVANKKAIFVIRADGSVVGAKSSLWSGESLGATLQPGDTVVVPEKALGGGLQWQSTLLIAQTASAIASTMIIALHY